MMTDARSRTSISQLSAPLTAGRTSPSASMSTMWNFGPGWEDTLIEAYGVAPDRERLEYYRRLWNET